MIYSFYSYKGGVGRTHLLANVAAYLCYYRKRRVLLIDWDLEAPGLHFYFQERDDTPIKTGKGLIDLLDDYLEKYAEADENNPLSTEKLPYPTKDNGYITTLRQGNGGRIDLLPAVEYKEEYYKRINSFEWLDFFNRKDGNGYLIWLKHELNKNYDYVFIDSRTGNNDYSGICNVLMPDANVLVMAPNYQNFDGCERMANRIINAPYTQKGGRKPYILPILSRVDNRLKESEIWYKRFAQRFGKFVPHLGLPTELTALGESLLKNVIVSKTSVEHNEMFSVGEQVYFTEEIEDILDKSYRKSFLNIADDFIEKIKPDAPFNFDELLGEKGWADLGAHEKRGGNYENARLAYEQAIHLNPSFARAYNGRGDVFMLMNLPEKATQDYDKAIEHKPENPRFYQNRGKAKVAMQKYTEALADFDKAILLAYLEDETLYNDRGNVKLHLGQYKEAIADFDKAIDISPDYADAYFDRGVAHYFLYQYQEALQDYEKALEIEPNYADVYHNTGILKAKLAMYEEAIENYDKALQLNPDNAYTYFARGDAKCEIQLWSDAISDYDKGAILETPEASIYFNRGNAKYNTGLLNEALEDYDKAIELEPHQGQYYSNRGVVKYGLNQYKKAIQDYLKAIELNPKSAGAYNNLGNTQIALQQYDEAKKSLEKAIELDSSFALAYLNLARLYSALKNKEETIKLLQKVVALNEKNKFQITLREDFDWLSEDSDFLALVS